MLKGSPLVPRPPTRPLSTAATATGKSVPWPSGCKAALHSASQTTTLLVSPTIQVETIQTPALCPRPRWRVCRSRSSQHQGGLRAHFFSQQGAPRGSPQVRPGQPHPHLNMETPSQLPFQHPCPNCTRIAGLVPSLLGVPPEPLHSKHIADAQGRAAPRLGCGPHRPLLHTRGSVPPRG